MIEAKTVTELYEGHPERWIKGEFSVDHDGGSCESFSPYAVKWCLSAALNKIYGGDQTKRIIKGDQITERIKEITGKLFLDTVSFNDAPTTTFEDVLNLVKELNL